MKVEISLTEKQSELDRSLNTVDVTGYGGAKGGGKSHGLRSVILLRSLTKPGHVGALFRRTYPELEENHIAPLFRQFPELRGYYNAGRREIRIPALESEFKFRFCERQGDVDKYAGREYHTIGIEEAGDWPTDMAFRLIRNCNRSTVKGIKAASALTFNWGGVGHGGLKRIFFNKDLREHEKKLSYHFILAKVEDNPAILENDPGYLDRLESEPNEALRRAYRDGDPDIVAGQYFELSRENHVIAPFKIPRYWKWFGSYDYGYNHPATWHFFAVDTDGKVYLAHEIVQAKMSLRDQAEAVFQFIDSKRESNEMDSEPLIFEAGHDCWAKKKSSEPTIAEDFQNEKVVGKNRTLTLRRANISRVLGAYRVREYLQYRKVNDVQYGPNVLLFNTCIHTIDCLTRMVHDPNKVEDVLKVDANNGDPSTGDDPYDCFRYGLMSRPSVMLPSEPPPIRGTLEYEKKVTAEMEEEAQSRYERFNQEDDLF